MRASHRHAASPQWRDGRFRNPQPLWNDLWGSLASVLQGNPNARPGTPIPVELEPERQFRTAPGTGLRATWLGHSTVFLELDGVRILTDPVWGERASPLAWAGPRRFYPAPVPLERLPRPDVVVISHNHYDHLDQPTIRAMAGWSTRFVVPLGLSARLQSWGIAGDRITELDWWESVQAGAVTLTCTPARHASGRGLLDKDASLWAGYALAGPRHRVYFSGDTGLFPGMAEIGTRLGPFDLTLIEIGAYGQAWPDWHLGPEQALQAHALVRGRTLLPIHWGLFNLAAHGWTEPMERLLAAAGPQAVPVLTPRPGQSLEPDTAPGPVRWWPDLPWQRAEQNPIRATLDGLRPVAQN